MKFKIWFFCPQDSEFHPSVNILVVTQIQNPPARFQKRDHPPRLMLVHEGMTELEDIKGHSFPLRRKLEVSFFNSVLGLYRDDWETNHWEANVCLIFTSPDRLDLSTDMATRFSTSFNEIDSQQSAFLWPSKERLTSFEIARFEICQLLKMDKSYDFK